MHLGDLLQRGDCQRAATRAEAADHQSRQGGSETDPDDTVLAMVLVTVPVLVVALLSTPLIPPDLKKNWVPYCRLSLRSTSATMASIRTCNGTISTRAQHLADRVGLVLGAVHQHRVVLRVRDDAHGVVAGAAATGIVQAAEERV